MEIRWNVGGVRVFESWDQASVLGLLVGPFMGEVWGWGLGRSRLRSPGVAPATASVSVVEHIVAASRHVVHDSICVDADTSCSASLDQVTEFVSGSTAAL